MILFVPSVKYAGRSVSQTMGGPVSSVNPSGKTPANNAGSTPNNPIAPGAPGAFKPATSDQPASTRPQAKPIKVAAELIGTQVQPGQPIPDSLMLTAGDIARKAKNRFLAVGHDFTQGLAEHLNDEAQELNRVRAIAPHREQLGSASDKSILR